MEEKLVNVGKNLEIKVEDSVFARIPIKTHVIKAEDIINDVVDKYAKEHIEKNDVVFIAETVVAITQNRAVKLSDIEVRKSAEILSKFVYKNPHGIGISMPETMEMAIREVGISRILFASAVSVVGKLFKKRGLFYKVVGEKVRDIDGPTDYAIPPYNNYVVLSPENPQKVAESLKEQFKADFMIVDANDLGVNILGNTSKKINNELAAKILKDNPLGQSDEQTPIGLIRKQK